MPTTTTTVTSAFASGKITTVTSTQSSAPAVAAAALHTTSTPPEPLPSITLYELGKTRSARVRWALQECGLDFKAVSARPHTEEVLALNPNGKLPVLLVDATPLTESAAIATYIADLAAKHGRATLIAASGTYARAQHDQWVSFALSELDTWKWHSYNHARLPAEKQCTALSHQCLKVTPKTLDHISVFSRVSLVASKFLPVITTYVLHADARC